MVVSLNRQSKFDYFNSIFNSKDTKIFWKQCQPYFSKKHVVGDSKIMLIENDKMVLDNEAVSEEFKLFFANSWFPLSVWISFRTHPENMLTELAMLCQNLKLILAL